MGNLTRFYDAKLAASTLRLGKRTDMLRMFAFYTMFEVHPL